MWLWTTVTSLNDLSVWVVWVFVSACANEAAKAKSSMASKDFLMVCMVPPLFYEAWPPPGGQSASSVSQSKRQKTRGFVTGASPCNSCRDAPLDADLSVPRAIAAAVSE